MTTHHLIDQLGTVKARIAALEAERKALAERLKQALLAEGLVEADGRQYHANLSVKSRTSISAAGSKFFQHEYPVETNPVFYSTQFVETLNITARELAAA